MNVRKIDTFSGHRDSVYTIISDGTTSGFYSAGADGFVIQWDLKSPDLGKLVLRAGSSVYALCFDPENKQLWIGQNYEGIQLFDVASGQIVNTIKITSSAIFDIKIWQGKVLIALGDGVIVIMDVASFSIQKHIKVSDKSIRSIAINPVTNEFAAGDSSHQVHIFDLHDCSLKHTIQSHSNSVFAVRYSHDNRYLLSMGRDAHVKVWEIESAYEPVHDIAAHMYAINHADYSPDGRFFATCSMDKSIKVWDSSTFRLQKVIDRSRHAGHGTSVNKLLWSSYQNHLISCSDDRTISVWEIEE
jgi:WD40 repeat protein